MFQKLKYSVTFPVGGTFAQDLDFASGLTAIVGPNESGKSLILEMLRYALWGSAALRGIAEDYKSLSVQCTFVVRGESYTVDRSARKAELRGAVNASGTTAVNAAIVTLMGFGIAVFDMACSINQGEVEQLGKMKPAARKQLVDSVLGIGALEIVSKWAVDEARLLEREAEALQARLQMPQAPERPEDYQLSSTIDLVSLRALTQEAAELRLLVSAPISKPTRPEVVVTETQEELVIAESLQAQGEALRAQIAVLPFETQMITATEDQWVQFEAFQRAHIWLTQNPAPAVDVALATQMVADHDLCDLMDRLAAAQAKGGIDCPSCQTHIPHEHDTIDKLLAELNGRYAERPALSRAELQRIKGYDWNTHASYSELDIMVAPSMTRAEIAAAKTKALQVEQRLKLETELSALTLPYFDARARLADLRHQQRLFAEYEKQLATFGDWAQRVETAEARLQEIGELPNLMGMELRYQLALTFERALATFDTQMLTYATDVARVNQLTEEAAEYRRVKETLQVLRVLIKQHLLPSLNMVASQMLRDMTGGQRAQIQVDDEFEIQVDGQRLETLSGSGKACANLALRIGLGQVLTNRVFSTLLADEIDESMDQFRSENTSNLLEHLQKHISQVLLVSHKSIEAPTLIDLGTSVDLQPRRTATTA